MHIKSYIFHGILGAIIGFVLGVIFGWILNGFWHPEALWYSFGFKCSTGGLLDKYQFIMIALPILTMQTGFISGIKICGFKSLKISLTSR